MNPRKRFLTLALLLLVSATFAQEVRSRSIVVRPNNQPEPVEFSVDVFISGRSGTNANNYPIGEDVQVSVSPSLDAYVYLFSINSNNRVEQIYPNRFDDSGRNNFVRADSTKYFPPRNASYSFTIGGPPGRDILVALATVEPLRETVLTRFADYASGEVFASSSIGEGQFSRILDNLGQDAFRSSRSNNNNSDAPQASGRSIIVEPVEPDQAVLAVDAVRFRVRRR